MGKAIAYAVCGFIIAFLVGLALIDWSSCKDTGAAIEQVFLGSGILGIILAILNSGIEALKKAAEEFVFEALEFVLNTGGACACAFVVNGAGTCPADLSQRQFPQEISRSTNSSQQNSEQRSSSYSGEQRVFYTMVGVVVTIDNDFNYFEARLENGVSVRIGESLTVAWASQITSTASSRDRLTARVETIDGDLIGLLPDGDLKEYKLGMRVFRRRN